MSKVNLEEKKINSEEIFDGRVVHLFKDEVTLPNGEKTTREYLRHVGAVCVLPVLPNGDIVLERQWRYPHGRAVVEIPAGKLDGKAEDREKAALRELEEETGLVATRLVNMGDFLPTPAYSDELITMYLATEFAQGAPHLDKDEFLEVFTLPFEKALEMVLSGQIQDAKTQLAIVKYDAMKKNGLL